MNTLSKTLLFVALAIVFLSACAPSEPQLTPIATDDAPAVLDSTPQQTTIPESEEQQHESEAVFSATGFGMMSWTVGLIGDNKGCFADLRFDPRACDGKNLKVIAKTPLLVLKNGEFLTQLKDSEFVELKFDNTTDYEFFGLADRDYPFYGEWRSTMFMWSDASKTYPVMLLPQKDGHDQFVDLADGVTYDFPANQAIFDQTVPVPTLGRMTCIMGEFCSFVP